MFLWYVSLVVRTWLWTFRAPLRSFVAFLTGDSADYQVRFENQFAFALCMDTDLRSPTMLHCALALLPFADYMSFSFSYAMHQHVAAGVVAGSAACRSSSSAKSTSSVIVHKVVYIRFSVELEIHLICMPLITS